MPTIAQETRIAYKVGHISRDCPDNQFTKKSVGIENQNQDTFVLCPAAPLHTIFMSELLMKVTLE